MNVREALKVLIDCATTPEGIEVEYVAFHFERALRAAWERGYEDCLSHETGEGGLGHSGDGVTAGVAAMMEER